MPFEETKILEFNQRQKSDEAPFAIQADLESLIKKTDGCKNNPKKPSTSKVSEYIPSGFSMSKISSFKCIGNKNNVCRGKGCVKNFCESLTEHSMKIINFKKKKMKLLTKKQQELYENAKVCYICEGNFKDKYIKGKKYCKVRDYCDYIGEYRVDTQSISNVKHSVPKETRQVFHNGPNYEKHFLIKELVSKFEGKLICLEKKILKNT